MGWEEQGADFPLSSDCWGSHTNLSRCGAHLTVPPQCKVFAVHYLIEKSFLKLRSLSFYSTDKEIATSVGEGICPSSEDLLVVGPELRQWTSDSTVHALCHGPYCGFT